MIEVKFGPDGLIPVVAQDDATGQVLMVAYMNREALGKTLQTGRAWYWSRSRGALWRKGEDSGHTQTVRAVRVDCDADALLLLVEQIGAACHTGHRTCFFRDLDGSEVTQDARGIAAPAKSDILDELFEVLKRRRSQMPAGSYTTSLLRAGRTVIAEKVQEEAEELVRAAQTETDQRVTEEAADLVYHTWLLLVERGVELLDVRQELRRRRNGD